MPGILDKDKLPNEGLKKLAEEAPQVVKKMGFKDGGVAIMIAPQEDMKEEMPEAEPMKSDEQMENDLRKSRQQIGIQRMKKLGMKYGGKDFITDEKKSEVRQLKDKGLSYRQIQEQVNMSLSSILSLIHI